MIRRVLVAGAWDDGPGYPRTRSLLDGLETMGIEVRPCRVDAPWLGPGKRALLQQPWRWPELFRQRVAVRRELQRKVIAAEAEFEPDAILVPYPGQVIASAVGKVAMAPVVLDLFLSALDTAAGDRRMFAARSVRGALLGRLERQACLGVDRVLLDTPEHVHSVSSRWNFDVEHFGSVPVGDPDAPARPKPWAPIESGEPLRLLYCGTGVPLHGLPLLVEAVAMVRRERVPVELTVLGGDDDSRRRAEELGHRVLGTFAPRDVYERELERAQLVAGVFGAGPKARSVIPFKLVHGLAAGRPVLTGDTAAVRGVLEDGVDVLTCASGSAAAIAGALHRAVREPQRLAAVAARSRAAFERCFGRTTVGRALVRELMVAAGVAPGSARAVAERRGARNHGSELVANG